MKKSLPSFADILSGAPLKEYPSNEEKSALELTSYEKNIVIKAIHRIGIIFAIEGFLFVALIIAALLFGVMFVFSMFT